MSGRGNPYARPDARTRAAKARGYPARSVYKLEEIQHRCRVFRDGGKVLDLGAAPGSWTMYASEQVGPGGRVLAVDLSEIKTAFKPNVQVVHGDALDTSAGALTQFAPYDVVMSDMAPRTSGSKIRDKIHSFELALGALEVAARLGKRGSHFIAKIFMSGEFPQAKKAVTERYESCRVIKPEGTRSNSTEVFLVGLKKKDGPLMATATPQAAEPAPATPALAEKAPTEGVVPAGSAFGSDDI